jgi:hypothetical protein
MRNSVKTKITFRLVTLLACLFLPFTSISQVSIVNASINSYNITPRSLCEVSIMNTQQDVQVVLDAKVLNSAGEILLGVKSSPFYLHNGMNSTATMNIPISSMEYGGSNQANYIRTSHTLPSGKFNYCCTVSVLGGFEESDDYCVELESDLSSFLLLVNPADRDTVDTPYPNLIWNHSEPFSILASGEYYRMVVVELLPGQSPEAGINVNLPQFTKNFLTDHSVPYPFDAKGLVVNKRYGWQVQLVSNGIITNKSEAWEFCLRPPKEVKVNKYAALKKTLDGGFYTAESNKLFFKFDEQYASFNPVSCFILDSKRQLVKAKVLKDDGEKNATINLKSNGYNRFEINLDELDVSTGYYVLQIKNEKNETFLLKFYVK